MGWKNDEKREVISKIDDINHRLREVFPICRYCHQGYTRIEMIFGAAGTWGGPGICLDCVDELKVLADRRRQEIVKRK